MTPSQLQIAANPPKMRDATLLLALTGWMDGGLVSTGTVKQFMEGRKTERVAYMDPGGFYIDNFPGSMDVAALFRPHVKYENGIVTSIEMPTNEFHADPANDIAFFVGKEPNLDWPGFAECLFNVAERIGVKRIIFIGSFGGSVPHTREPRLFGSVSEERLLPLLKQYGLRPSDYEGPGSFASYLLAESPRRGLEMVSIAAEIPGYLEGLNPLSIEAVTRRLAGMLELPVDIDRMRTASNAWEVRVSEAVEKDEELAETVKKLETEYDDALIEAADQS